MSYSIGINRRYVEKNGFYYLRVDYGTEHTDVTPHIYDPFWDDLFICCMNFWPNELEQRWAIFRNSGKCWFKNEDDFMLVNLSTV